jgi:hypothetical protein
MSPVGSGLAYGETPQMAAYPKQPPQRSNSFSLWDDRSSKLFQDARAMSVGDILTVDLAINDKASFDNATDRSRKNPAASNAGINIPVINAVGAGDLEFGSNTSTKGQGTTERSEKLSFGSPRSSPVFCPTAIWSSAAARKSASTRNCAFSMLRVLSGRWMSITTTPWPMTRLRKPASPMAAVAVDGSAAAALWAAARRHLVTDLTGDHG